MAIACRYCIATRGLKGSEIAALPQTDEEFVKHVETEHHIPVRGENETEAECRERFKRENPEAGGPNCKCPLCQHNRGDARTGFVDALMGLAQQSKRGGNGAK